MKLASASQVSFLSNEVVQRYPSVVGWVQLGYTPPFWDGGGLYQKGGVKPTGSNPVTEGNPWNT